MNRFWIRLGATFFFTGYFPVAPATFASFVTLVLWWFLPPAHPVLLAGLILVLTVYGIWVSGRAEDLYGHDGKPIVIDEVVGVLLTIYLLPHTLGIGIAGFLLFRVLDVVKPPPAYQFQSFPRGYGVMFDDIMAGIYGNLALRLILAFWPGLLAM